MQPIITPLKDASTIIRTEQSLAEKVFDYLESAILSMQYPPGTVLNEATVADSLNISRSPAREAILHLENLGMVKKSGRKRVVSAITPDVIYSYYELWEMVEPFAAKLACNHASKDHLNTINDVLLQMDQFSHRDQINVYRELNLQFHSLLVAPCPNRLMVEYHSRVMKFIRWGSNYSLSLAAESGISKSSHYEIFQSYKSCDSDQIEYLLRQHISSASMRIQNKLDNGSRS